MGSGAVNEKVSNVARVRVTRRQSGPHTEDLAQLWPPPAAHTQLLSGERLRHPGAHVFPEIIRVRCMYVTYSSVSKHRGAAFLPENLKFNQRHSQTPGDSDATVIRESLGNNKIRSRDWLTRWRISTGHSERIKSGNSGENNC